MRIIGTCCFWNSEDIIEAFVRHSLSFCTELILLNHGSPDASPEIVRLLQKEGLPVHMISDPTLGNVEVEQINRLLKLAAHDFSADWIVTLDDDEFLGGNVEGGFLPPYEEGRSVCRKIRMRTYYASPGDAVDVLNPVERITHRLLQEPDMGFTDYKVMVPGWLARKEGAVLAQGKHKFYLNSAEPSFEVLEDVWLAHFSLRSPSQYASKIVARQLQKFRYIPDLGDSMFFYDKPYEALRMSYAQTAAHFHEMRVSYAPESNACGLVHDPMKYRGAALRYTRRLDDTDLFIRNILHLGERLAFSQSGRQSQDVADTPPSLSIEAVSHPVPGKRTAAATSAGSGSMETLVLPLDCPPGATDLLLKIQASPGMVEIAEVALLSSGGKPVRTYEKGDLKLHLRCLDGGIAIASHEFFRLFIANLHANLKLHCKGIHEIAAPCALSLKFRIDNHVTLPVFLCGGNLQAVALDQEALESRLHADFAPTHMPFCIDFTDQGNSVIFTGDGWGPPEPWGRWTVGGEAALKIRFAQQPARALHLEITAGALCLPGLPPVEATIKVNGRIYCNTSFPEYGGKILKFKIPTAGFQSRECKITFEIKNAQCPHALGNSDDRRHIGMGLTRIDCRW